MSSPKRPASRSKAGSGSRRSASGAPAYFCYILECADGTFYTGWTTDPERRLEQHRAGRGARYTRAHPPARLAFVEPQPDRASAMRRERSLKALSRARKQALIDSRPPGKRKRR